MTKPKILTVQEHAINPGLIDPEALKIVARLQSRGFPTYIVGGSVRDLLVGKAPKDFDISTSARPEEIKAIFGRQCLLIGRRFRLAHIRLGRKVYEVSTFRAGDTNEGELIVRDNVWGSEEEDVLRRDFTINGLYYDPTHQTVIDYVGGCDDLKKGLLMTIGDPEVRFRQDPVRMIRLLKFRARFRFAVESKTKIALLRTREEILKSSQARLLEELLRMVESGFSAPFFQLLQESKLLELILPSIACLFSSPISEKIYAFLLAADKTVQKNVRHPPPRAFFLSSLFFPIIEREIHAEMAQKGHDPHLGDIHTLVYNHVHECLTGGFSHFPKKILSDTCMILTDQFRLAPLNPKKRLPFRFATHPNFPHAFLLFSIRADLDPSLKPLLEEWHTHLKTSLKKGPP
jgi:poly(A) polymerase